MATDFTELYIKWIRDNTTANKLKTEQGEFTQISTPFLDRHNDHIVIYVKQQEDGSLFLTDAGYTLNDLEMCGCNVLSSQKRKDVLSTIIYGFGVQLDGEQICTKATVREFAQKKHSLMQAMLSVNDMFFLSKSQVSNVFIEDVQLFFDINDIRCVSGAQFHGASGLNHTFEFTIPAFRQKPERFIKAINDVSMDKVRSVLFSWDDIKSLRKPGSQLYVIMNDFEKKIREDYMNAVTTCGGKTILWSKREKYIEELAS